MRRAACYLVFPLLIAATLTCFELLLAQELDPEWAALAASALATGMVVVFERLLPYRSAWSRSHNDFWTDLAHFSISGGLVEALRTGLFAACALLAVHVSGWVGAPLWPVSWPLPLQLTLALLLTELGAYLFHRLSHTRALLWRVHAMHHTVPRLYWLNAARLHPADTFLSILVAIAPLVVMGAGPHLLSLYLVVVYAHGLLQHSNVDTRLGALNWIFAGAELHRWHHSQEHAEQQSNYGGVLIIWDLLFGTRFLPEREPPVEVGLGTAGEFPMDYAGQLLSPFRSGLFADPPAEAAAES